MAYLFNGATHIINRADALLQTWPITFHGRIRLTASNDQLDHCIIAFAEASANNGFRMMIEGNAGTMKARCTTKSGGAANAATTTTSISDTNWHSVVGEITSATARQVWLDNAGNGTNATSATPGTLTKTSIGAQDSNGTIDSNVAHELADVAVWSVSLTADERESLNKGVSPLLIRPDKLELYLPLIRGGNDYMGAAFTVTDATVADHPRVYMPSGWTLFQQAPFVAASNDVYLFDVPSDANPNDVRLRDMPVVVAATDRTGTLNKTLDALTTISAAKIAIAGTTAKTLGTLTTSSAARVAIVGAVTKTLGNVTLVSAARVAIVGTQTKTLGAVTVSSAAKVAIAGTLSKSLAAATLVSTSRVAIKANAAFTLGNVTAGSASALGLAGTALKTLANLTIASTARIAIAGTFAKTLDPLTLTSAATISGGAAIVGTLTKTLDALTVSATATIAGGAQPATGGSTKKRRGSISFNPQTVDLYELFKVEQNNNAIILATLEFS